MTERSPLEDFNSMSLDSTIERTLAYHQRTKHHLHQYARSPGYLDWATQPDPFRTYAGAPRIEFDLLADRVTTAEKLKLAERIEKVFPRDVAARDCKLSHTRPVWRLENGRAVLVAYEVSRGPIPHAGSIGTLIQARRADRAPAQQQTRHRKRPLNDCVTRPPSESRWANRTTTSPASRGCPAANCC